MILFIRIFKFFFENFYNNYKYIIIFLNNKFFYLNVYLFLNKINFYIFIIFKSFF